MILDKFLPPFIDFMDKNFGRNNHKYVFITSEKYAYGLKPEHQVEFLHTDDDIFINLLSYMKEARKIILHGLWRDKVNELLAKNITLLNKSYWVIWGGDLYSYKLAKRDECWHKKEVNREIVIKNIFGLVTYVPGDVELARKWYGATGNYVECLMYTSNLYKEFEVSEKQDSTVNIQVGNSADPSNNHIEALEKLLPFKDENICIYVPLSYGNPDHAQDVIKQGNEWFGAKFLALTEFMEFNKYLEFLGSIDIAIFNHKRQQAMGNTITLLGLGKKVFIRNDVTQWQLFKNLNINVGDIHNLELQPICRNQLEQNKNNVKTYFSKENYLNQLQEVFQ